MHFKRDATHHALQCFVTPNQLRVYTVSGCFVVLIKSASDTLAWLNTADLFSCFPTGSPNYSRELVWGGVQVYRGRVGRVGLVTAIYQWLVRPKNPATCAYLAQGKKRLKPPLDPHHVCAVLVTSPSQLCGFVYWSYLNLVYVFQHFPHFPEQRPFISFLLFKFKKGREWRYVVRASFKWPAILIGFS